MGSFRSSSLISKPLSKPLAAVVDLGTNTFHLLIGRVAESGLIEEVERQRHFVKVASDGIDRIGEAPYARAIEACESIGEVLARYPDIPKVAFATAAMRTADNGPQLRQALSEALGVEIQIIDGDREAGLIAKAVLAAPLPPAEHYLIMDIGGGSVEFILTDERETLYRESFPVGAQVLRKRFHTEEPFAGRIANPSDVMQAPQPVALVEYLSVTLAPMLKACEGLKVQLVGSSGTFDVLADLYGRVLAQAVWTLDPAQVRQLFTESAGMTEAERFADTRIPDDRADMIVVALGLIDFVIERLPQIQVVTCAYALKEGALMELLG